MRVIVPQWEKRCCLIWELTLRVCEEEELGRGDLTERRLRGLHHLQCSFRRAILRRLGGESLLLLLGVLELQCEPAKDDASLIGEIFSKRQLSADGTDSRILSNGLQLEGRILLYEASCCVGKGSRSAVRPPRAQTAGAIVLAALVIEAVRQLKAKCEEQRAQARRL